ncbi:MAG: bifunctional glutamate N-acetyltransferase/amino-acid acetyltransferase ArgJ [Clostridiales bacterium]|nr:bifunctional glutamate N-acetyltransferase/amino-acid acetyltransferase ArgJ [Clostridiales bacterium]
MSKENIANVEYIEGGVTAAKGFTASGVHCGIRKNRTKRDLGLIMSEVRASAAAVYTTNLVKGAPLLVTKDNISDGRARAMICNSGNANTCNADGEQISRGICSLLARSAGIDEKDVIVASTGVIGQRMDIEPFRTHMDELVSLLSEDGGRDAAEAIMTTDTFLKEAAVVFTVGGKECRLGGIAKGSGMIAPNMATMLIFVTTDCAVSPEMLQKAVSADVKDSFNMVSVDGDTSTNDMFSIMANGMAGNEEIAAEGDDFDAFTRALNAVTTKLCRMLARDGEGATRLLECRVSGAADTATAKTCAKSVISSSLLKAAMFGADANWGRVLCALGYSGADIDVGRVDVSFASKAGSIDVCKNGAGIDFSEEVAKKVLLEDEISILVGLNSGEAEATAWGCDLTYDYVKINGDYRT